MKRLASLLSCNKCLFSLRSGSPKDNKKVPQNIDFVGLVFLLSPLAFLLVIRLGHEPCGLQVLKSIF